MCTRFGSSFGSVAIVNSAFPSTFSYAVSEHPATTTETRMAQEAVAKQADGHPAVVLKDIADHAGAVVAHLPNGNLLTIVAELGDFVKVRREASRVMYGSKIYKIFSVG